MNLDLASELGYGFTNEQHCTKRLQSLISHYNRALPPQNGANKSTVKATRQLHALGLPSFISLFKTRSGSVLSDIVRVEILRD